MHDGAVAAGPRTAYLCKMLVGYLVCDTMHTWAGRGYFLAKLHSLSVQNTVLNCPAHCAGY